MKAGFKCKFCNKIFFDKPSRKRVYCSSKCRYKVDRKKKFQCKLCNKIFFDKPSRKRVYCSYKCRNKFDSVAFRGKGGPFYGRKHSLISLAKMSNSLHRTCLICGKSFKEIPSRIKIGKGKYCSQKCYWQAQKKLLKKQNNPNWRNGISKLPYHIDFDSDLKEKIRRRDNYTCQVCNMTEEEHLTVYGELLSVHHINYDKQNCSEKNLMATCKACNARLNFNRDYWQKTLMEKINDTYSAAKQF